tara:strand:- start:3 stop:482 length:480 start_codon:yes stop_codon:yes gene_type:complete
MSSNNTNDVFANMLFSLLFPENINNNSNNSNNIKEYLKKNTFNFYEIQNKSKYNLYECSISLCDFDSPYIKTTLLDCGHYFCEDSILQWCLKKNCINCPICRKDLNINNSNSYNSNNSNSNSNNNSNNNYNNNNNFNNAFNTSYNNMMNFLNSNFNNRF